MFTSTVIDQVASGVAGALRVCNSDAPQVYHCPVCKNYKGSWPPSAVQKRAWSETFWKWLCRPGALGKVCKL